MNGSNDLKKRIAIIFCVIVESAIGNGWHLLQRLAFVEVRAWKVSLVGSFRWLAINGDIFTTYISQIAKRFKPQPHNLLIERIQFAHWGNVEQNSTKETNITFKRALSRDEAAEEVSGFCVLDLDLVESCSDGVKERSDEFVEGEVQHDRSPGCLRVKRCGVV
jgi:hypothetical protein